MVLFAKESGSFQSHSPSRAAAAKPRRGRSPRVLHGEAMPFRLAIFRHVMTLPTPLTLALSRKGRGDGYRGRLRFANRPYAKVATAPDSRYQIAPLTINLGKGVNRRPSPYYGARVVLSMVLMD